VRGGREEKKGKKGGKKKDRMNKCKRKNVKGKEVRKRK
jgi:hypothetical protein